jgi:hypothetical protein
VFEEEAGGIDEGMAAFTGRILPVEFQALA